MVTTFKTLRDYLYQDGKQFVVPNYQRGYKWAVKNGENISAVEKLMDDLIKAYRAATPSYFIQGITVSEDNNSIVLIDGQQRTTTLYLLLWCIDQSKIQSIDLQYDIRKESKDYINNLKNNSQTENKKNQDVYYFKKAIEQIQEHLQNVDNKEKFLEYILNNVQILYIVIDKDKATKTFTMMNGSKATMLQEELVKAEMLRLISMPDTEKKDVSTSVDENLDELKEIISKDWEINALRSRYAREWDKWLYWWNREDVKDFFNVKSPMGLLLEYYYKKKQQGKSDFNFENFRKLIDNKKSTKEHFKGLRDLQKSFEDIFNTPKIHNYLGMSLIDADTTDKYNIISYFIEKKKEENTLADYAKWRMVGATHTAITTESDLPQNVTAKEECAQNVLLQLSDNFVYGFYNDAAFKQLIRLNAEEDNRLNRSFDFTIWQEKSLEHIYPKSRVYHSVKSDEGKQWYRGDNNPLSSDEKVEIIKERCHVRSKNKSEKDRIWLNRVDFKKNGSEHCIGNLVLLYGRNNSEFGNKLFQDKKKTYFDTDKEFKSRHLLHTVSVFAEETWREEQIKKNRQKFIERFEKEYNSK